MVDLDVVGDRAGDVLLLLVFNKIWIKGRGTIPMFGGLGPEGIAFMFFVGSLLFHVFVGGRMLDYQRGTDLSYFDM